MHATNLCLNELSSMQTQANETAIQWRYALYSNAAVEAT